MRYPTLMCLGGILERPSGRAELSEKKQKKHTKKSKIKEEAETDEARGGDACRVPGTALECMLLSCIVDASPSRRACNFSTLVIQPSGTAGILDGIRYLPVGRPGQRQAFAAKR